MNPEKTIWMDGQFVPWDKAQVHVMTHSLHYGSAVFEGIRSYVTPTGVAIFRLHDHLRRLFDSARIYGLEIDYSLHELRSVCHQLLTVNGLDSAYFRPLVYLGGGQLSPVGDQCKVHVSIAAIRLGAYLGEDGLANGIDVGVSSWQRVAPNTVPTGAKATGNYLTSRLVGREARRHGYAEGLVLSADGLLSEGAAENLFLVRDGVIFTPGDSDSILGGITRHSVIELARAAGYKVRQQSLPREWLYTADEIFLTGTAAEVTPVRSVDRTAVGSGKPGPVTRQLSAQFMGLFSGQTTDSWGWLDHVEVCHDHKIAV